MSNEHINNYEIYRADSVMLYLPNISSVCGIVFVTLRFVLRSKTFCQGKKDGKDQESIQSSTTPDP